MIEAERVGGAYDRYLVYQCPECSAMQLYEVNYSGELQETCLTLLELEILQSLGFWPMEPVKWLRSGLMLEKIHSDWYLTADFSSDSSCLLHKCAEHEFPRAMERWISK